MLISENPGSEGEQGILSGDVIIELAGSGLPSASGASVSGVTGLINLKTGLGDGLLFPVNLILRPV